MRSLVAGLRSVSRARVCRREVFKGLAALSLVGGDAAAAQSNLRLDRSRRSLLAGEVGNGAAPSLAFDGDTALIGSRDGPLESSRDVPGTGGALKREARIHTGGTAAVFAREDDAWIKRTTLTPGTAGVQFGSAVAVDGATALVGDPFGEPTDGEVPGVVWMFRRQGEDWVQATRLVAPADGLDRFGTTVALDGQTALVGANTAATAAGERSGAVAAFVRRYGDWTHETNLVPGDTATGLIGSTIALDDDVAVVGGQRRTDDGHAGVALVFERRSGRWIRTATLGPDPGGGAGSFGEAVAVDSDAGTVLVGAPGAADGAGRVSVFTRTTRGWTRERRLRPVVEGGLRRFGTAVAVDGDQAVVTAAADQRWDGDRAGHGAAHLFTRHEGRWHRQGIMPVGEKASAEQFGATAALAGHEALVGTHTRGGERGRGTGAAHFVDTG